MATCEPPEIDWDPPQPRPGVAGWLDRFVGPGATAAELLWQFGAAFAAAVAVPAYALAAGLNWSTLQLTVSGLIAMDLVGGVVTNATAAGQRWYHRSGQGPKQHLAFAAIHIVQLLLVGWFFRNGDWVFVGVFYAYLMLAVTVVCLSPLYLQRPIAMMSVVGAVFLNEVAFPTVPGMAWFVPVFFVKLLICHLLKEAPSWYLKAFWKQHNVKKFFNGSDCYGDSRVSKTEMINIIKGQYNLNNPIYIGDTKSDMESTLKAKIAFGYAEYGFGKINSSVLSFGNFEELTEYFIKI
jgi:hypothetical protein